MRSGTPDLPMTDLHSHLAPGVDDGAPSLEDALEGIGRMVECGFGTIVTTPHLEGSLTRNPAALDQRLAEVDDALESVQRVLPESFPGVRLERGHEIMLDIPNPDFSDHRVRLAGGPFALVEWPWFQIPPESAAALRRFEAQGVIPLIAHPERYFGYDSELSQVGRWRDAGAACQVSYGSIVGKHDGEVRARALRILQEGWADCLSTDFHGRPTRPLYVEEAKTLFQNLEAEEAWTLLTETNPRRISVGERPLPVPPVRDERGLLSRILSLLRS